MDSRFSGLMERRFYQNKKASHSFTISNGSLKKQALIRNQILKSLEKKRRKRMIRGISPRGSSNSVREEQEEITVHSNRWWDSRWLVDPQLAIVDHRRLIKMHIRSWLSNKPLRLNRLSNHSPILMEQVWCHLKRWRVMDLVKWVDIVKAKTWINSTSNSHKCLISSKSQKREKSIVEPLTGEEVNSMMTRMTTSTCQNSCNTRDRILVIFTAR